MRDGSSWFLANVNSRSRSLYDVARLSVVGNARAPYSADCNFRQYFYGIWYVGHPLTSADNFTEIAQGNPSAGGVKYKRFVSDIAIFVLKRDVKLQLTNKRGSQV